MPSRVTCFSDRTPKCKLGDKGDFERLASEAEAAKFSENAQRKIEELTQKIEIEKARKYPSTEYINSLYRSIDKVKETVRIQGFINAK